MKRFIKLSLVTALALSTSALASTVEGTITAYSYDVEDKQIQKDVALTLKVSHKVNDIISMNATVVSIDPFGATNTIQEKGSITTEANIVATYAKTTLKSGRQYIESPMFTSFDWLMKPVAYQANALINKSINNTTLIAVDAKTMAGNTDMEFTTLKDKNRAYGIVYANDNDYSAQAWYYNIEHSKYTQAYIDTVATFGSIELSAQFVNTDFDENKEDSKIYGIKASTKLANIEITVAAAEVKDVLGTSVGADSIYTSMWNSFASDQAIGKSSLISLSTKIAGLSLTTAYANYEGIDNYEGNVIAEYSISDTLGLTGVYTDTDKEEALEVMATYSF